MDTELIGYIVLFILSLIGFGMYLSKDNSVYASEGWTKRHIDSKGNYRA
jgi:hypothetical protein